MRTAEGPDAEERAEEQLMKSFRKSIDDILLEEFACGEGEIGMEPETSAVQGQGSGDEEEVEKEVRETLFEEATIRDKGKEKEVRDEESQSDEDEMKVTRDVATRELRKHALKHMQRDEIKDVVDKRVGEVMGEPLRQERRTGLRG